VRSPPSPKRGQKENKKRKRGKSRMEREKTKAKLMAWTLFPTGLALFFIAMFFGVGIPGTNLLMTYSMDAVALLGLILMSIAVAAAYAYFRGA